eukprot:TRINITY_DN48202_c0_g1_i1.p1 TRINITY_DN48202_c0_g1~~TRINITY_DN48202_c0_g1_i1.p1  ORF type:complete len:153 (+),score=21.05 TRINITY_DN48202_c0_g1_i1:1-459(+)
MGCGAAGAILAAVGGAAQPSGVATVAAHERLRRKLRTEMESVQERASDAVRVRLMWHEWLGWAPEFAWATATTLFYDPAFRFSRVTFQGQELKVWGALLGIYAAVTMATGSSVAALCVSIVTYFAFLGLFRRLILSNLPRKALMDERVFLRA